MLFFAILAPILFIVVSAFGPSTAGDVSAWNFSVYQKLPTVLYNTLALCLFTAFGSSAIGLLQALLIELTDIPWKKPLHILFIVPLAFPLYVLSFIYVGGFEYSGDIPTWLRNTVNWNLNHWFSIKSLTGATFVFSMALAPYSYLFIRSKLQRLDGRLIHSARSLGKSPWQTLRHVILPIVFPWSIASSLFVGLEVLADFGGVSVFNIDTFSVAIFQAWTSLYSLQAAMSLSLFPIFLSLLFFVALSRIAPKADMSGDNSTTNLFRPNRLQSLTIGVFVVLYLTLSVFYPSLQLLNWALTTTSQSWLHLVANTLSIGLFVVLAVTFMSLAITFYQRFNKGPSNYASPALKIYYGLPGSLLAVGVLAILSRLNLSLSSLVASVALGYALSIKFLPVALEMYEKSVRSISQKVDWSALSLGASRSTTLFRIHMPIMTPAIVGSISLLILEVAKEMPITLILRPFGFDTLSTKIYELTTEGEWEQAALFGMVLVIAGTSMLIFMEPLQSLGHYGSSRKPQL